MSEPLDSNPYHALPEYCFWKKSVSLPQVDAIDPVIGTSFQIKREDKIASLGSCFAQNITRYLRQYGLNYLVTESAHPLFCAELSSKYNYGTYSVRSGNIYTARQLLQLLKRAYGDRAIYEGCWVDKAGYHVDPLRPQIQPKGFLNEAELVADLKAHLRSVRRMVEECDVFIFTLGLTEAWVSETSDLVYPICPNVIAKGLTSRSVNKNFNFEENLGDLLQICAFMRNKNARIKILLTVSPVPLVATFENRSVIVSTCLSKSTLRVAAQYVSEAFDFVEYFPSYEIVTSAYSRGAYFAEDCRTVTQEGVDAVMRLFKKHLIEEKSDSPRPKEKFQDALNEQIALSQSVSRLICDEEVLERGIDPTARA